MHSSRYLCQEDDHEKDKRKDKKINGNIVIGSDGCNNIFVPRRMFLNR